MNQPLTKAAAIIVALTTFAGLFLQFGITSQLQGSLPSTLWALLEYFTITTNLLVLIVFALIVARPSAVSPSLVACTTLNIMLVGAVYGLLLHGLAEFDGISAITNVILHMVVPVLVPIFWLLCMPKGQLRRKNLFLWATYPLGYLVYALIRGKFANRYPYPFLNINTLGWSGVLLNSALIAAAFLIAAWLFIWVDTLLARRGSSRA